MMKLENCLKVIIRFDLYILLGNIFILNMIIKLIFNLYKLYKYYSN